MNMNKLVEWAISQLGVVESPPHSNNGEPMKRYALSGEQPLAWCARFVRTGMKLAGNPLPGNQWSIASVANLKKELEKVGAWHPVDEIGFEPAPGDLVLLGSQASSDVGVEGHHVGIVEKFESGIVHSIDGNWSDKVARVQRNPKNPKDHIWGYGRWPQSSVQESK